MHNIKAKNLQVDNIESREEVIIAIQNLLRYAESLVPTNDYDLVPKWYIDTLSVQFTYLDQTSPYVTLTDGGSIAITDFATAYPSLSSNGMVRANIDILSGGVWTAVDVLPDLTKDIDGNILTATWNLNQFGVTIDALTFRMY